MFKTRPHFNPELAISPPVQKSTITDVDNKKTTRRNRIAARRADEAIISA
jgi:hypothetical protein